MLSIQRVHKVHISCIVLDLDGTVDENLVSFHLLVLSSAKNAKRVLSELTCEAQHMSSCS